VAERAPSPAHDESRIEDAYVASRIFDAQRLRVARHESGLASAELAGKVGVSGTAVSQWETGTTRPRAHHVELLAGHLRYPVAYFATTGRNIENLDSDRAFFRSLRESSRRDRDKAAAHAVLIGELTRIVARHAALPVIDIPMLPAPESRQPNNWDPIDEIAQATRDAWGLGVEPIPDVLREIERHGVIVARLPLADEVEAFSWPGHERPIVILGVEKENRIRSRFSGAHELGHLVMHRNHPRPADPRLEKQAHRFANAFILPRARLKEEWPAGKIDWRALMELKTRWQISLAALLYRARQDGLIEETMYESATRYLRRAGWSKIEPGDEGPPERPRVLETAVHALAENGFDVEALAHEARLPSRLIYKYVKQRVPRRVAVDI
jgi:Zn-dependent peptidase ImmA (M78 family)/transcriptional regulator with XRE-family HTH domain